MLHNSRPDQLSHRLVHLDALRGLAALVVVVFHVLQSASGGAGATVGQLFDLGQFGVCLFFVISGYTISASLDRTSPGVFWWRRVLRLYPVYWLSIALIVLLAALGIARPITAQFAAWPVWSIATNLTMIQPLLGADHLMGVYWTLYVELWFYVLATLLVVLRVARHSAMIALCAMTVALLGDVLLTRTGIEPFVPLSFFALMFSGATLFRAEHGSVDRRGRLLVVGCCMLLLAIAPTPPPTMLARVVVLPLYLLATRLRLRSAALVWLGQISYPLYLLHEIVIAVVRSGSDWLDPALWIAGSVLVAWLVHRTIEQPLQRLGRRSPRSLWVRRSRAADAVS